MRYLEYSCKINGISFTLIRSASDAGALYGSVSAKDIMDVISENGIVIAKNQINLEKPIKELGIYKIIVSLHPEISSEIIINVARTDEEAKLQEKGKENNSTYLKSSKNEEDNVDDWGLIRSVAFISILVVVSILLTCSGVLCRQ